MAQAEREIKFDEILKSLLDRHRATVTQKKLATALGVSGTTVSHYVTGRIRPSFQALIAIAAFFNVTLDYLVFGERVVQASAADADNLRVEVMRAMAETNAYHGRQRDLVVRVNRRLYDEVERVARALLEDPENASPSGFFTDAEAMAIEACARRTRVMTRGVPASLAVETDGMVGRGPFFDILLGSVLNGRNYQYLFYGARPNFEPYVKAYRDLFDDADLPPDLFDEHVDFRIIDTELPAGLVLYDLDLQQFERREPVLWERFRHDGIVDGIFAYVSIRHEESNGGIVLRNEYLASALRMFDRDWTQAKQL
ncbi:hypothetical protein GCM10009839_18960 [Catenulispora yoronensis]|uniref:HTH cro/C1-type domain-containing protein n=1 Tax=Catenulispora yoronensis TaxID=450799 RepID=A0ABN2TVE0_9ACTN